MSHALHTPDEVEHKLELAARGVVPAGLDARWEPILLGVACRGVVTAADRRAAQALLAALAREAEAAEAASGDGDA